MGFSHNTIGNGNDCKLHFLQRHELCTVEEDKVYRKILLMAEHVRMIRYNLDK